MANFGTNKRIPTTSTPSSNDGTCDDPKSPYHKLYKGFTFSCPFNIPTTPEFAAIRIIRNLDNLGLYYTLFVWIILFITLIPVRKVSLILLVIMSYVTTLYLLLLRAYPNSKFLHRVIDKRLVLALLAIATAVQLIVTEAGIHLGVTLACAMPVVLAHAVLWVSVHEVSDHVGEAFGGSSELAPLSEGISNVNSGDEGSNVV